MIHQSRCILGLVVLFAVEANACSKTQPTILLNGTEPGIGWLPEHHTIILRFGESASDITEAVNLLLASFC